MERTNPFQGFNFDVSIDGPVPVKAVFQEVSGLGNEITVAEYRTGTDGQNHVRKIPGMNKSTDVTLKRGVIGVSDFYAWIKQARDGLMQEAAQRSSVTISLLDETGDKNKPVMTWELKNAFPIKYTAPSLNAKGGTDVAIEEVVIAYEWMVVK